jgi:FAD/FMN-containing dehydrogenase
MLAAKAATMPTPATDILICQLGGAIGDVAPDATAFPHRDAAFMVTPGVRWEDQTDDARCLAWIGEIGEALRRDAGGGAYVNFIAESHGRERDAYGANYERLAALKHRYDPANVFSSNQNVRPAA